MNMMMMMMMMMTYTQLQLLRSGTPNLPSSPVGDGVTESLQSDNNHAETRRNKQVTTTFLRKLSQYLLKESTNLLYNAEIPFASRTE
jgi:hypothetical protein